VRFAFGGGKQRALLAVLLLHPNEPHRGRGGGRALLEAALRHARRSRLHKVELEVFPDNGAAIALYTSVGFAVEGVRREHYLRSDGNRRSALLMALLLEDWKGR
jgi:RimJ/RimL family protein N-acetyltransferase